MNIVGLEQVPTGLKELLGPDAPDVCIEAVGFHYMNSWMHKIEAALLLETDTSEILNEIIFCCRKVSDLVYYQHCSWGGLILVHREAVSRGPDHLRSCCSSSLRIPANSPHQRNCQRN